jgi:peptidyl-prolyl cis-trans isomerase A (cyclophilin A)
MKKPFLLSALLGLALSFQVQAANIERVRVTTNFGAFVIEMQRDRAPLTVENFLFYVKSGYYTNTLFHRVISGFVIQGGQRGWQRAQESARHGRPRARQWSALG